MSAKGSHKTTIQSFLAKAIFFIDLFSYLKSTFFLYRSKLKDMRGELQYYSNIWRSVGEQLQDHVIGTAAWSILWDGLILVCIQYINTEEFLIARMSFTNHCIRTFLSLLFDLHNLKWINDSSLYTSTHETSCGIYLQESPGFYQRNQSIYSMSA